MAHLLLISGFYFLLSIITFYIFLKKIPKNISAFKDEFFSKVIISALLMTALLIKLIFSTKTYFAGDIYSFNTWMNTVYKDGILGYYSNYGMTYPPLHMVVLYLMGVFNNLFKFPEFSSGQILLLKFPAILCDIITVYVIYSIAKKHLSSKIGIYLSVLLLFNPGIIINSTIWGQVDSIYTLFIVLMCYFLSEHKTKHAYFAFAISLLFKYQAITFFPVLVYGIIDQVILNQCTLKKFFSHLFTGITAIIFIIILHIPFIWDYGQNKLQFSATTSGYKDTLSSFPYASVNAYNFWALIGKNFHNQNESFLFISCKHWGYTFIVVLVLLSIFLFVNLKDNIVKYPLIAAFIISTMFLFSVRMHERYLFPVISLLLTAYALNPNKHLFFTFIGFSILQFLNVGYIFFTSISFIDDTIYCSFFPQAISACTLICWIYFIYGIIHNYSILNVKK